MVQKAAGKQLNNMAKKYQVAFFGTPSYSLPCLEVLAKHPSVDLKVVVTQVDKPAGRGGKISAPPVKELAQKLNIPIIQPISIRKNLLDFLKDLAQYEKEQKFDLAVVIAFGQILPQALLDHFKFGCLNLHASILPRWRGAAPIQRAIMAGDKTTGVCLMKMEAGLDTGPVLAQQETPILDTENYQSLHDKLAKISADLIAQNIDNYILGKLQAQNQASEGVTIAKKISHEDARIDWNKPAKQIELQIRALSPFPGAFSTYNGKRLKIFAAKSKSLNSTSKEPGSITLVDTDQLEVQTADTILALEELQLEGKKKMTVAEFLRGVRIEQGEKLT